MKLFSCEQCGRSVYFDSSRCTGCGSALAYFPERRSIGVLESGARPCRNLDEIGCNWACDSGDPSGACRSCRLTELIPDLAIPGTREALRRLEAAKRRLLFSLAKLALPLHGLSFAFLRDEAAVGKPKILTGHHEGRITINLAEADDPQRERIRVDLGESYRTLLGHFRHEIGHYYWNVLIRDAGVFDDFRKVFGDERADYAEAGRRHYSFGPPPDWPASFISAYASMHPWEDFAETWAHYLHMTDTLETARAHDLGLKPKPAARTVRLGQLDPESFDQLIGAWLPLTVTLNELSRSMGLPDAYPFVLPAAAIAKLRWVHERIAQSRAALNPGT